MSDKKQKFKSKTIGFRMSPGENAKLDRLIKLSGMTKQDYIIERLNNEEITVNPNPRVFQALENEIIALTEELKKLSGLSEGSEKLIAITMVVVGMVERLRG